MATRQPRKVPTPHLYREFLGFIFDPPEPEPYVPDQAPGTFDLLAFQAPSEIVALYLHLMRNLRHDLPGFSVEQIASGIRNLFDPGESDTVHVFRSADVPSALRCEAIRAMTHLYVYLFAIHCAPVMSHIDQAGGNKLNSICYMLWDITSLKGFPPAVRKLDSPEREACRPRADAVLSVLEAALYSENIACVESGLHGLGHIAGNWPAEVSAIIDLYQRRRPNHDPRILHYADMARQGLVQ